MVATGLFIIFLLVAISLTIFVTHSLFSSFPKVKDHEKIVNLTSENFQEETQSDVVLIDVCAESSMPSQMMMPILNDLVSDKQNKAHVAKLNIEQNRNLAQYLNIKKIPTLLVFKNGKEINRFVGVKTKDFLLGQLQNV